MATSRHRLRVVLMLLACIGFVVQAVGAGSAAVAATPAVPVETSGRPANNTTGPPNVPEEKLPGVRVTMTAPHQRQEEPGSVPLLGGAGFRWLAEALPGLPRNGARQPVPPCTISLQVFLC